MKKKKLDYIKSNILIIILLSLPFLFLCFVGKFTENYLIIGGAVVYAFIAYIFFYNKMMTYVESDETD